MKKEHPWASSFSNKIDIQVLEDLAEAARVVREARDSALKSRKKLIKPLPLKRKSL